MNLSKYKPVPNIISLAFLVSIYYVYVFDYAFSFNYHTGVDYHYALLTFSLSVGCFLLLCSVITVNRYQLTRFDFLVGVVFILFLVRNITSSSIHNETSHNALVLVIVYFIFRNLPLKLLTEWFTPIILTFFFIQLHLGYKDIYNNWNESRLNLSIIGSLKNSGVYAIYLAIHLPLIQFYLQTHIRDLQLRRWLFYATTLAVLAIVWLTQSRTGLSLIFLFMVLNFRTWRLKYRQIIVVVVGLIAIAIFCWLIYARTGSIAGRYLIWKISLLNIRNHLLLGTGYGSFSYVYPQWQILYFKTLPFNNISEILHADESYVAFNEPLQFLIENGLLVALMAGMVLLKLLWVKGPPGMPLIPTLQRVLAMIMLAGCTSYPLHINAICFLFCCIVAVLSPYVFPKTVNPKLNKCLTCVCFISGLVGLTQSAYIYVHTRRWIQIRDNVFITDTGRLHEYQSLYEPLHLNGKFLLDYGELLYLHSHSGAAQKLEESRRYFFSTETLVFAGKVYEAEGDYPRAIENYKQLTNLVPYQFGSRAHLVSLYLTNQDTLAAVREASFIVLMPVKKDSVVVRQIKENMLAIKRKWGRL